MENSARIIGSPCTTSHISNEFNQLTSGQPKKFEKMIMKIESSEDDDDDDYDNGTYNEDYLATECKCPELVEDFKEDCVNTTTSRPDETQPERRKFSQQDYRSMLWLAFLNGLVTGAALSTSAILFWIYCCKYRCRPNNRQRRQRGAQYGDVPSETPPPSYHDLFREFPS